MPPATADRLAIDVAHFGNERGARRRIAVVEPVDVGEDDQRVGLDQRGAQRGQPIVVAELDLVDADGVVLVDHRHGAGAQQFAEREPRVQVAAAIAHVVVREQHLPGGEPVRGERALIGVDEVPLPDGGGRLQPRDRARLLAVAEPPPAERDRARGDDDDVDAAIAQRLGLGGERGDARVGLLGQEARADLDDDPLGRLQIGARLHGFGRRFGASPSSCACLCGAHATSNAPTSAAT